MAYAALVSLAQTTNRILNPLQYSVSVDAKPKIMSIHDSVRVLLSFLENYPAKANRFEATITDVANEAEDILEYFMWNQIHNPRTLDVGDESGIEFDDQLEKATGEISSIAAELMDIKESLNIKDDQLITESVAAVLSSRNASTGGNDIVIGLDHYLTTIKDQLYGGSSRFEVIPIAGMGGIGKTTLARYAYNDALIIERFDIRVWVTVSQDYSVDEILSRLVDSMKWLLGKNKLPTAENVSKCLKGRRYLVVLDDVWSTKTWDDVRNIFPDDNNGSRIMLTTRLLDVAAYPIPENRSVHEMKFMDEKQSWNLLQQKVFTSSQNCPPELEGIGKEIAQGCRGLPLAVVLVAGILHTVAKDRASWKEIAENVISVVDGQLEKILSLSYTHLPHYLRPCFLYISGFPEDYEIHASRLIKLWVGEGFLKSENGCRSLEEEGEECLEDLVRRSLVLVTRRKATGQIKSCSLHDMVRASCIRRAQEEKFLLHIIENGTINKRRIGSIFHSHFEKIQGLTIRTFLCLRFKGGSRLSALVGRFRLLRVLDVVCFYVGLLPSQLFELFHLRYLALGTPDDIPAAISNLYNLQTLIINPKTFVCPHKTLPLEIWRMQQLRHLVVPIGYRLPNPIDGSTLPLENLQTLMWETSLECSEEMLKMVPNLKKLELAYIKDLQHHVQNFLYLHQLEKLKISNNDNSVQWLTPAFPRTLKKLTLVQCRFPWKDMSIIGSLPVLQVLKLRDFHFRDYSTETWETAEGEFLQLRYLLIHGASIKHWITESSHFPKLKHFVLQCCYCLSEIPESIGEIPTLELLEVDDVNQSLAESAKQILADQQDYGNDTFQLRYRQVIKG